MMRPAMISQAEAEREVRAVLEISRGWKLGGLAKWLGNGAVIPWRLDRPRGGIIVVFPLDLIGFDLVDDVGGEDANQEEQKKPNHDLPVRAALHGDGRSRFIDLVSLNGQFHRPVDFGAML